MVIGQAKDWTGELRKIKVKLGLGLGRGWSWSCWEGRGTREGRDGRGKGQSRVVSRRTLKENGRTDDLDSTATATAQQSSAAAQRKDSTLGLVWSDST